MNPYIEQFQLSTLTWGKGFIDFGWISLGQPHSKHIYLKMRDTLPSMQHPLILSLSIYN